MLLDQSAAFDCVDHTILLSRLESKFGITGSILRWCSSYLSERTFTVRIRDTPDSTPCSLDCGVPQGSVLGPLFFSLYTADILTIIQSNGFIGHMYADDAQCYQHFFCADIQTVIFNAQNCFEQLSNWMSSNRLKLNPSKTEVIILGSIHNLSHTNLPTITLGGAEIAISTSVRNLGVILDSQLKFDQQVQQVFRSCMYIIRELWRVRPLLTHSSCESLVLSLVISRIDYCNSLLCGTTKANINKLQLVQNAACRLIMRSRFRDHVSPLLKSLHWLRVSERITFKVGVMTYKCLHDQAPAYLSDMCIPLANITDRRTLRSSSTANLAVPRTRTKTYGSISFASAAPLIWNALPPSIQTCNSLTNFKSSLKTHLFLHSYPD